MTTRDRVYEITRSIPKGKVATYGQVAKLAGVPGAARFVGLCMRNNPDIPATPCHRVVASNGDLTGYAAKDGLVTKRAMLLDEGIAFKGNKVDLTHSQWKRW